MPVLRISNGLGPELAKLPIYAIGQRMRIVSANVPDNAPSETKNILQKALGRVFTIKDILLWETGRPEIPYQVTYEFHVGHLNGASNRCAFIETIYMDDDEVEPVARKGKR